MSGPPSNLPSFDDTVDAVDAVQTPQSARAPKPKREAKAKSKTQKKSQAAMLSAAKRRSEQIRREVRKSTTASVRDAMRSAVAANPQNVGILPAPAKRPLMPTGTSADFARRSGGAGAAAAAATSAAASPPMGGGGGGGGGGGAPAMSRTSEQKLRDIQERKRQLEREEKELLEQQTREREELKRKLEQDAVFNLGFSQRAATTAMSGMGARTTLADRTVARDPDADLVDDPSAPALPPDPRAKRLLEAQSTEAKKRSRTSVDAPVPTFAQALRETQGARPDAPMDYSSLVKEAKGASLIKVYVAVQKENGTPVLLDDVKKMSEEKRRSDIIVLAYSKPELQSLIVNQLGKRVERKTASKAKASIVSALTARCKTIQEAQYRQELFPLLQQAYEGTRVFPLPMVISPATNEEKKANGVGLFRIVSVPLQSGTNIRVSLIDSYPRVGDVDTFDLTRYRQQEPVDLVMETTLSRELMAKLNEMKRQSSPSEETIVPECEAHFGAQGTLVDSRSTPESPYDEMRAHNFTIWVSYPDLVNSIRRADSMSRFNDAAARFQ